MENFSIYNATTEKFLKAKDCKPHFADFKNTKVTSVVSFVLHNPQLQSSLANIFNSFEPKVPIMEKPVIDLLVSI